MDKQRNIELENWLIETTGEEMMANHLGPNWNRFHEEYGFYPNISMTIADQVWEHRQTEVDELQKRVDVAQKLIDDWNCGGVNLFDLIDELEQALKGGEV
ncbi:hypothetical protein [Acinetobacter sp. FDAARGOS_515]|uniref:hypothetical protein n=1 Tax=Acinetobacter sp. FDAARGOS_515 TaxID=2420307 RepID=UPI000F6873E9|nr:hypothetical protein [Acinetobacter sp. FDAARGOS_515]RSC23533.1 hypothetical protein EGS47_12650 [Acinetobacter sp. FDAARGOS_515]